MLRKWTAEDTKEGIQRFRTNEEDVKKFRRCRISVGTLQVLFVYKTHITVAK
jgi:hypothetical protein